MQHSHKKHYYLPWVNLERLRNHSNQTERRSIPKLLHLSIVITIDNRASSLSKRRPRFTKSLIVVKIDFNSLEGKSRGLVQLYSYYKPNKTPSSGNQVRIPLYFLSFLQLMYLLKSTQFKITVARSSFCSKLWSFFNWNQNKVSWCVIENDHNFEQDEDRVSRVYERSGL